MKLTESNSVNLAKPLAESAVAPGECGSVPDIKERLRNYRGEYCINAEPVCTEAAAYIAKLEAKLSALAKPEPSAWDTDKRAAFEKWAAEYDRLFMSGSYNNKITWSAYRAGVDYQASTNKDTATLSAYRTLIHTHHPAPDGSEFGFCRVRFDARGQVESCLWAGHDEVDAAVAALVEAESGISSPTYRPNEKDVVGEGK